jgi:hypothetical protein
VKRPAGVRFAAAALLCALAFGACGLTPVAAPSCLSLDLELAMVSARLFAMDGEPAGTIFENQTEQLYEQGVIPNGVWRIQVDAIAVIRQANQPGGVVRAPLHWIIDVDKCSGERTIFAQG